MSESHELSRGLNPRHVQFIAIGTAIGTGLFFGSSETIQTAGPAVLLAYLVAGSMVFVVMRALGEMAVRHPVAGSFAQYAGSFLGPFAGFIVGWVFWLELAVVAIAFGGAAVLLKVFPLVAGAALLRYRRGFIAGAIAAIHLNTPVIHVHGGERSGTNRPKGRTRDQLYAEAKNLGIEGRSSMNKEQLRKAVDARK